MRRPFAALLSLSLLACEGGSAGGNSNDDAPPSALVQEGVPENLTDDRGNTAVPLEPPPAALPTPAASASASAAAAPASVNAFPAPFRGRWGLVAADCEPGRDDAKGLMEVGPTTLRFYESRATATVLTRPRPARIEARLDFTGEGQERRRVNALTLVNDDTLIREERDPATSLRYARCPT